MAEPYLLRRASAAASRSAAVLHHQSHRIIASAASTTASADAGAVSEDDQLAKSKDKKGKWFTLPQYTSAIDAASLGKKLAGRSSVQNECRSCMTALKWTLKCCPQVPRSLVHKLFRLRQVRRQCCDTSNHHLGIQPNERQLKRVAAKDLMKCGDRIFLPIIVLEPPVKKHDDHCNEEEMNFIHSLEFYKDSAIIAINKPPGLPVQGGIGVKKSLDELASMYLRHDCSEPPRLVHRLDRDSSGVLVMGRTQTSTALLHSIFREKTSGASNNDINSGKRLLQKRYLALVIGVPKQMKGLISGPLAKVVMDDGKSERVIVTDDTSSSQHALTEYRVIETSPLGYAWLELCPLTGRKHQLRVHCAEILGTPMVGDYKYGWQAHRGWRPLRNVRRGVDEECGSISEKQPHLHLHCKEMVLPNVALALKHVSLDSNFDFSKFERLNLVAPLPFHMQNSWDILNSLQGNEFPSVDSDKGCYIG